jgi:xanthine dehydrogenase iron-sulfur cluster and FAD-binding subunit A
MVHSPINSCLVAVPNVEGAHVTTVEAIGNARDGLHPVQRALVASFGSQCGYCTPGFVMALYTSLLRNPYSTVAELEKSIDGNLCRCTGYRPIADALRHLAQNTDTSVAGQAAPDVEAERAALAMAVSPAVPVLTTSSDKPAADVDDFSFCDATTPLLAIDEMTHAVNEVGALHLVGQHAQWYAPRTLQHLLRVRVERCVRVLCQCDDMHA